MKLSFGPRSVHELPAELPEGEHVIWQGAPGWWALARSLHIVWVAAYLAALFAWYATDTLWRGAGDPAAGIGRMAVVAGGCVALFALYAFLVRWNTSYTLTTRRLIIQAGIALPISFNIPFSRMESAAVKTSADGSGDIVLTLLPGNKIGYVAIWPHARPWSLTRVRPMLRAVPDVGRVSRTLLHLAQAHIPELDTAPRPIQVQPTGYGRPAEQMIAAE